MKKVISLILILSVFPVINICGDTPPDPPSEKSKSSRLEVYGNFPKTRTRSLFDPVVVFQSPYCIEVYLSNTLGEVSVRLYDATDGVVYDTVVDASTQSELLIDTMFLDEGMYRIEFENSEGLYLYGSFVIE